MAFVPGTNKSDYLDADDGVTNAADTILGYGGPDVIFGLGGADIIRGGYGETTFSSVAPAATPWMAATTPILRATTTPLPALSRTSPAAPAPAGTRSAIGIS